MAVRTAPSPQPTTVYARTGKGVLAYKNRTAKLPDLKDLFECIDGKASVAELGAQTQLEAEELEQALDALEEKGYIKIFKHAAEQAVPDFTEAPDLDFTSPGSLLEVSVREAAKAKADAEQQAADTAARAQKQPAQAPPDTSAQAEAMQARIHELEAEAEALKRARNEAIKAGAQAKSLAAEERKRSEELAQKLADAETRQPAAGAQTGATQEALEMQLATERETREQMVQALREAQSEAEAGRNAAVLRLKEAQIALQAAEKVDRQNREAERRTREGLQAELAEAKLECERTGATVREHSERIAKLEAEIDTERRARADAEAKAGAERDRGEKATQTLLEMRKVLASWKDE